MARKFLLQILPRRFASIINSLILMYKLGQIPWRVIEIKELSLFQGNP